MNPIELQCESDTGVTGISNIFIDQYMPSANGEYVKVFLYLLRLAQSGNTNCSPSQIADVFDHTEKDILRAFIYWERMGLLELSYDNGKELSAVRLLNVPSGTTLDPDPEPSKKKATAVLESNATSSNAAPSADKSSVPSSRKDYTKEQLSAFMEKDDVQELLYISEHYMGRPLTATEIQTIFFWFDGLQFSVDLIDYLIEYCINRGHTSIHYMDKVALGWAEIDIRTVAQAKKSANLHSRANYAVIKALGIKGRNLVELETTMIQKWTEQYAFSLDIVEEACSRTIAATHQPSFEYTDRILTNWHNAGVKTMEDIKQLDATYQQNKKTPVTKEKNGSNNKFNNFVQRSYDYDQLERKLLSRNQN